MNILRNLLVLSLFTFVLVGCSGDGATLGKGEGDSPKSAVLDGEKGVEGTRGKSGEGAVAPETQSESNTEAAKETPKVDFVIYNASPVFITVNKMKVIPISKPDYEVEKSIELESNACVRIKKDDAEKISIRSASQFPVSEDQDEVDYVNICSLGECGSNDVVLRKDAESTSFLPLKISSYPVVVIDCDTSL